TMLLKHIYDHRSYTTYHEGNFTGPALSDLISHAMWSSEPVPFDPMEKTLHQLYGQTHTKDRRKEFKMIHEYPLEGKAPMMTHISENDTGVEIIAAKGAPEAIIRVSLGTEKEKNKILELVRGFGKQGFRVLGVAKSNFEGNDYPDRQQDFKFEFLGLLVFYDPPKKGIHEVFQHIYDAGIKVKVITGDNADTTYAIAQQAGIENHAPAMSGAEIIHKSQAELISLSRETTLFTRMFPEAKLAMVNAFKQDGEVVAMLGDGVNDAPALKAAHIGVAMGTKGTEMAKSVASLVIVDDNLDKLVLGI